MKKELIRTGELSQGDVKTLVTVGAIPANTPEDVIRFFSKACAATGLSPFRKQIFLIKRRDNQSGSDKYTLQTAIDGYRTIADRTGKYAGNDDYLFNEGIPEYELIKEGKDQPETATATVWKIVGGSRCPFQATVRWREYYPGEKLGFMWKKMPFLMLGKCAEALALRKAFPEETAGIFTEDEMTIEAEIPIERPKIEFSKGGKVKSKLVTKNAGQPTELSPEPEPPDEIPGVPAPTPPPAEPAKKKTLKGIDSPGTKEPDPPIGPNQAKLIQMLHDSGHNVQEFLEACREYNALDPDQDWDDIDEKKFGVLIDPDNWLMLRKAMEPTK